MKRLAITLSVLAAVCAASTPAMADEAKMLDMMQKKACVTCHKVDGRVGSSGGPSYKEVAAKYSASDVDMLVKRVLEGTVGKEKHWEKEGITAFMTPNKSKMTEDEAREMVNWILGLK